VVRVTIDRPGGVDMDAIARVTRAVSRALDQHDPIAGRYTLEVSSPGLERTLRTPAHFLRAVGSTVRIKTRPGVEGERRIDGVLAAADDEGVTVTLAAPANGDRRVRYDEIERARTVFEWGPAPKPGSSKKAVNA
jgi:ribosome maturation factor RimP